MATGRCDASARWRRLLACHLLLVTGACQGHENADAVATVPVFKATRGDVSDELTVTAEFRPYQEVDVMAKVAGYVRTIRVDIGDRVKQGDLLAILDVPEMTDELAKAGAAIEAASADVAAAQDDIDRARAARDMAHLSDARLQDVARQEAGLVPKQEVDVATSHALETDAQLAGASSRLKAAQQRSRLASAERTRLLTLQAYTRITAPFPGVVTKRYADTGSMIQAGTASQSQAMPLVRLSENSLLRLRLPVPESAVPAIDTGQVVEVTVPSLHHVFEGHVTRAAGKIQTDTRTMDTEVDVPNPDSVLVPGMYAEVRLHLDAHTGVVTVPLDAVVGTHESASLLVLDATDVLHLRPVQLGLETARRVEVRDGLLEGESVVVGRHAGLKEGQKVNPKVATYEADASPRGHGS